MGMLTLLLACNGPGAVRAPDVDADGDGFVVGEDCNEALASVHPGAREIAADGLDQDCDGWDPLAEATLRGTDTNEGFGTRVLLVGDRVVATAPFAAPPGSRAAGRVASTDGATLAGADGAFLGAGLAALDDGTVLVGAPGTGAVTTLDGTVLLDLPGAGGVLAARGQRWAASTPVGFVREDGTRAEVDRRPDALALDATGTVWAGFARGEVALRVGDRTVARGATPDEAGHALLFADLDADGDEELVVGAPGAGVVYVLDPAALPASLADVTPIGPGTGRFGAALAFGTDGVLYVGAPMAGQSVEGAVYAVRDGAATVRFEGDTPGDQLGAALSAARATLVVGAPGAPDAPGSVRVFVP